MVRFKGEKVGELTSVAWKFQFQMVRFKDKFMVVAYPFPYSFNSKWCDLKKNGCTGLVDVY